VTPFVPYHRVALEINGPATEALRRIGELLKGAGPLDGLLGAGSSNANRVTGRVDTHAFKLVVQPPRLWRIPYLPVLTGRVDNGVLLVTARPQVYELIFLPAWCAFVLFDGGPLWFGLGIPVLYHCIGWGVFSSETRRMIALIGAALLAEARG
jgi:hypothetical protein